MSEGDRFLDSRFYPVKSFIFSLDPERNYAYTKSKLGLFRGERKIFPISDKFTKRLEKAQKNDPKCRLL